jgi:hypothetical protein
VTVTVDEATVRQFVEIISGHVVKIGAKGLLQICVLDPRDGKLLPTRFRPDDVEGIVAEATRSANAGLNVYVEARTVRPGLRAGERGAIDDTESVFALVVDSDADKGKAWAPGVNAPPSLVVETSPGNHHFWYLFDRPLAAAHAKTLGDAIRANTGGDNATGVVCQPYRVAGTPNFPGEKKRERGRIAVESTTVAEPAGSSWAPIDLPMAAAGAPAPSVTPVIAADETSLPDDLLEEIRTGQSAKTYASRSEHFHAVIGKLKRRHWSVDQIEALLERHPTGVGAKYSGRLRDGIRRSFAKVGAAGGGGSSPPPSNAATTGANPTPGNPAGAVLPTIRLRAGQLPQAVMEAEQAVLASGACVFKRAGSLVYPLAEDAPAAKGGKTKSLRLRPFTIDSLLLTLAGVAIFQRYDARRKTWVDVDPPERLVRAVLADDGGWPFPSVAGAITCPTLRPDGSLLDKNGYDPETELYLETDLKLPPIPDAPTRDEALEALMAIKDLLSEFSFKQPLDLSVALAGLLTSLVRGSLPTAPTVLVRATAPGTGKSYLVDVFAVIATGRLCPVTTGGWSKEETEKKLGAVLLAGAPIISIDNLAHDLDSEILCQVSERPIVKIRVLGQSSTSDCEHHVVMLATGNNVGFAGDMIRRGLTCRLEATEEKPEARLFRYDAVKRAGADRAQYVAAALIIIRAYLAPGAPKVCGPFGSYEEWSTMVRSPLVWLGLQDPIDCQDQMRAEDPLLTDIRKLFDLWPAWFRPDMSYPTARIIEMAESTGAVSNDLKTFLLRVAAARGQPGQISYERLGLWLRRISGRVVGGQRLVMEHDAHAHTNVFRLADV